MTDFKPGDVAMAYIQDVEFRVVRHQGSPDYWSAANGYWPIDARAEHCDYRPLIVIDPEDAEQVERLRGDLRKTCQVDPGPCFADALREFARPTPRIEEPQGLGAVVEDAEGCDWHRTATGRWISEDGLRCRAGGWGHIKPARIVAPGVES